MLGAQAQTRGPILQGAKSLQTQDIFHIFVQNTIAQDDQVKLISNMRLVIQDTNMVIAPGLILIPSNMVILKKKLNGYNDVLTIATCNMKLV